MKKYYVAIIVCVVIIGIGIAVNTVNHFNQAKLGDDELIRLVMP